MSVQTNKTIIRAYVEAMNAGDLEKLRTLFTPDAQIWGVAGFGSLDVAMPVWRDLHEGLRMHLTVEGLAAEGDTVAARYVERGTWVGPFLGRQEKPSGKSYELTAMEWFMMKDGKIWRRWGARDFSNLARQIGLNI